MTQLVDRRPVATPPLRAGRRRSPLEITAQQLHAIDAFNAHRRTARSDALHAGGSRDARVDAQRRLHALECEHASFVAHLDAQLRTTGDVLDLPAAGRVVLAHRNEWFAGKLSDALRRAGLSVVTWARNGADAVGAALAEQPDLLLVEDRLPMVPGEDVVRQARRYCPDTVVAAQVDYSDRVTALRDAGASAVFTRQVPPADVAARLHDLVLV